MNALPPAELRRISKTMSWALRHAAAELGLIVDPEGYVAIADLLDVIREHHPTADPDVLKDVVDQIEPAKQRFSIEGDWIRANYGHSLADKVRHEPSEPPEVLLHGTSVSNVDVILRMGLKPMRRQYVHLTTDARLAGQIGTRQAVRASCQSTHAKRT